eukprot:scaffold9278_cov117-Isochrysis_galbana.AAC.9
MQEQEQKGIKHCNSTASMGRRMILLVVDKLAMIGLCGVGLRTRPVHQVKVGASGSGRQDQKSWRWSYYVRGEVYVAAAAERDLINDTLGSVVGMTSLSSIWRRGGKGGWRPVSVRAASRRECSCAKMAPVYETAPYCAITASAASARLSLSCLSRASHCSFCCAVRPWCVSARGSPRPGRASATCSGLGSRLKSREGDRGGGEPVATHAARVGFRRAGEAPPLCRGRGTSDGGTGRGAAEKMSWPTPACLYSEARGSEARGTLASKASFRGRCSAASPGSLGESWREGK